jgi:curved DNA-binding protein CbpA
MSEQQDFYELLGVEPTSSVSEIKEAFRRLAQKYHPDRGSITAEHVELFKRITEAYRVLSNIQARNDYNREQGYLFHESVTIGGVGVPEAAVERQDPTTIDIATPERDWNRLHQLAGGRDDLQVEHKLAQTDEAEMQRLQAEADDVTAWGDLDGAPVSGGIFSGLLGGRRKERKNVRRGELKKNLKRQLEEENTPKRPSKIFETKATAKQRKKSVIDNSVGAASVADPLRNDRVFQFQITAIEAALGTRREIVLNTGNQDKLNKLIVDIPPGIENDSAIEVARGWERATAKIRVVQDPRFAVLGNDIYLRIPITLKEALDGARITVPGLKGVHEVTLKAGHSVGDHIRVEDAGISKGSERGCLIAIPFVVSPTQLSLTLEAAAKSVDSHYERDVRGEFSQNPLQALYSLEDSDQLTLFPPITFGEAIFGARFEFTVRGVQVRCEIPKGWDFRKEIISTEYMASLKKLVRLIPGIAIPQRSSGELQGAALAIEQHFLAGPRSSLPRTLAPKTS